MIVTGELAQINLKSQFMAVTPPTSFCNAGIVSESILAYVIYL
jgi:hypothetical protein